MVDLVVGPLAIDGAIRPLLEWQRDWKTQVIATILRAKPGDFLDVGASVGQTLLDFLCAPVRSRYVGFEPDPVCCEHLARLIGSNRLEQCHAIPAALGDRNGVATLYRSSPVDFGATTMRELRPALDVAERTVCMFRLDDLADTIPVSSLTLVKIDVEGTELAVLRGMETTLQRAQPWILCEVLHRDAFADAELYRARCTDLMRFLTNIEYEVHRVVHDETRTAVVDVERVTAFPDLVWNEESERLCDYLFVPVRDSQAARQLLLS